MAKKIKEFPAATGLLAWLYRLPVWFYRLGLGFLLGGKFVLINHIGRKTGLPRSTVLEVVTYDSSKDTYLVCSAYGSKADWYQNLLAQPAVEIQVGSRKLTATAQPLPPQIGAEEWVRFTRRTGMGRTYAWFLGYQVDGTDQDYRQMGEMMLFIALRAR